MQISINAKSVALSVYVVSSFLFILYVLATDFRDGMLRNAYEGGRADTVKTILEKVADGKCQSVNLYSENKKVDVVDVACVSKAGNSSALPTPVETSERK